MMVLKFIWMILKGLLKGVALVSFGVYMIMCLMMYDKISVWFDDKNMALLLFAPGWIILGIAIIAVIFFVTYASWLDFKEEENKK